MKALAIIAIVLGGTTGLVLGWLDIDRRPSTDDAAGRSATSGSGNASVESAGHLGQGTGAEQRVLDALAAGLDEVHWPWRSEPNQVAIDPAAEFQAALEMSNVMARRLRLRDAVTASPRGKNHVI